MVVNKKERVKTLWVPAYSSEPLGINILPLSEIVVN